MVAAAHALIGRPAAGSAVAGFYLDSAQGAVIAVAAMILAALDTAADIVVGIFLRHNATSIFFARRQAYVARKRGKTFNC